MLDRSAEIDDLAQRIFLAEHFCSRSIQAAEPDESVDEVRLWMELNDFDQAIQGSPPEQVILHVSMEEVYPERRVGAVNFAIC